MSVLDVWLEAFDEPVGRLETGETDRLSFAYRDAYLNNSAAHAISLSLPLQEISPDDSVVRAFFQNLLPENNLLDQVVVRERLERHDIGGILQHLGADLSGAISCLPEGAARVKSPGVLAHDYMPIDDEQLIDIVRRLGENAPLPHELRDPSPVSGYQRKIAVTRMPDGRYAVPLAGTGAPTTHILKVPEIAFPREAYYEANCASLATHSGLDAAQSHSRWIGQYETIISRRFDRRIADGAVFRLHQEDFAQALGFPPRLKYQREGRDDRRFDVGAISAVLKRTESPALAVDHFLRATVFNLAIGNTDNHAKNHALLYDRGAVPRLAPLYDLVPITLSQVHTHELSFTIGNARYPAEVGADDLRAFLAAFGMEGPSLRRFVKSRLLPIIEPLSEDRHVEGEWAERFNAELTANSRRLLESLLPLTIPVATRR